MRICGINYESFNDAEGVSCVLFISGCKHYCEECHSPHTWDFNVGSEVDKDLINEIRQQVLKRPFIDYLVLSGGDPMYSAEECIDLLRQLDLPLPVWIYSGFTFEEIQQDKSMFELLNMADTLIDGRFEKDKRDITLAFRGSKNQCMYKKIKNEWQKID